MFPKDFYESAFADLKIDIIDQISEIQESVKTNPKSISNLMLFYEFVCAYGFSYSENREFIFDWTLNYFSLLETKHLSLLIKNNVGSIESILKAYRSLHEFDFEYDNLGLYLYKNTRYHSLYSAITLICKSEEFVNTSDNYFTQMTRDEIKAFTDKSSDEINKLRQKLT